MDDVIATVVAILPVVVLAACHYVPPVLPLLSRAPRSWTLSAAGGVSVAYVFLHLLPEVAAAQDAVEESSGALAGPERHAYVLALVGLCMFYGLERAALQARSQEGETGPGTFWVSIGTFGVYNAVIGYVVARRQESQPVLDVALFVAALGLHFIVNDLGLRNHHQRRYDRVGRPILITAVVAGWGASQLFDIGETAIGLAIAFLAGGVVLNVLKEELPEERESRFSAFLFGALTYGALLLVV